MATVSEELHELVDRLSLDNQRRLLELAQMLNKADQDVASFPKSKLPPGTPGSVLLRFTQPLENADYVDCWP